MNLSIRMGNRRMTRLTNAFSKKWANHEAMMNVFFGVYNFCKKHGTLKTSPAVAAGITDHVLDSTGADRENKWDVLKCPMRAFNCWRKPLPYWLSAALWTCLVG